MTNQLASPRRLEDADTRELERTQQAFLLARAQLAAARAEPLQLDTARRKWRPHRRRSG
jgi:hypothetical protein